jgi:hypothetical protein
MRGLLLGTSVSWLLFAALPYTANAAGSAQPAKNCTHADYRAWDFWVGKWRVHSISGQHQGSNVITEQEQGCLLVENWTSVQGGTGQSYNYYHAGEQQWHQLWVSQGAIIDYAGNLTANGAMQLEGHITYQADGRQAKFMGRWTPEKDGTVLQELSEWNAELNQWQAWFVGRYTPADEQPEAPIAPIVND